MPPQLALVLTLGFCGAMFWRDSRERPAFGNALWLPVVWIFFTASRFPGQWLQLFGLRGGGGTYEDGSPLDALFFLTLILWGLWVLVQRRVRLSEFARQNAWLTVFFGYCFVAILWSDFPFVAFKRWIKILGHPVMALVILTEPEPVEALRRVLKRVAYVYLPLSILFIKYFPEYGRGFDAWTGQAFNQGIGLNKNELGYCCMIFGLFFSWSLLSARRIPASAERWKERTLALAFLLMVVWLLHRAQSATSFACLVLGIGTVLALGLRWVPKQRLGTAVIVILTVGLILESTFDLRANIIRMLGRDPTLTDRTEVWADVLAYPINPLIGAGFESFWLGPRLDVIWAKWQWQPNQAHNGYIETYINLGWIGTFVLGGWILSTFAKCRAELLRNFDFGRFRLACLFMIVVYNYTEATFRGVAFVWTLFHLISIDYRVTTCPGRSGNLALHWNDSEPEAKRSAEGVIGTRAVTKVQSYSSSPGVADWRLCLRELRRGGLGLWTAR